jgi:hypothetical protein
MQRSGVSPQPGVISPPWLRRGIAALMFLCAVLGVQKGLLQFGWVPWFCMGLFYLAGVPRQKGESVGEYFKRPRAIASSALLATAVVGFSRNLYVALTK